MTFDDIKKLIDEENAKVIIVENGKPFFVITTITEYERLKSRKGQASQKDIEDKNEILIKEFEDEPLKIDDLPF